jgi:hypothetical protein
MLMHFLDPEKFADPEMVAQEFHDLNHQEQVGGSFPGSWRRCRPGLWGRRQFPGALPRRPLSPGPTMTQAAGLHRQSRLSPTTPLPPPLAPRSRSCTRGSSPTCCAASSATC